MASKSPRYTFTRTSNPGELSVVDSRCGGGFGMTLMEHGWDPNQSWNGEDPTCECLDPESWAQVQEEADTFLMQG